MHRPVDWFSSRFGLKSLAEEDVAGDGVLVRAIFWPAFGPYVAATVRDLGEVGEVELLAAGLRERSPKGSEIPDRWSERGLIGAEWLDSFRGDLAEARSESLDDIESRYFARDGILCEGEIRRRDLHRRFLVENVRDLWPSWPGHERFFKSIWKLARAVLIEEWTRRILAPDSYSYGDLLASEVALESCVGLTNRRRS